MDVHLSELGQQHPPAALPPPFPVYPHTIESQSQPSIPQGYSHHHHQLLIAQQRPVSPPSPFAFAPPPLGEGRGSGTSSGAHLQSLGSHHHQLPPPAPTNAGAVDSYSGGRSPGASDGGNDPSTDAGIQQPAVYHAPLAPTYKTDSLPSVGGDGPGSRRRVDSDASSGSSSHGGQGSPSTSRSGPSTGDGRGPGGPSRASGEGIDSVSALGGGKASGGRKKRPPRTSTTQAQPQVKVAPGPKENLTSIAVIRSYPTGENEDRPFQCDLCPQNFNRNHDLKRHRKIHMELKPFSCSKCNKHFSRKDALRRHWLVKGCKGGDVAGAGIPSNPAFYETRPATSAAAAAALSGSSKSSSLPPTILADEATSASTPLKPKRTGSSRVVSASGGGTTSAASSTGSKKHGGNGGKGKRNSRRSKSLGGRERSRPQDEDDGSGLEGEQDEDPDTSFAGPSSYSSSSTGPFKLPLPPPLIGNGPSVSPPGLQSLQIPSSNSPSGGLSPHLQRQQQRLRDLSPSGLPAFVPSSTGNGVFGGGLNLYLHHQQQQLQQQHQQQGGQYQQFQLPFPSHLNAQDPAHFAQSPTEPHSAISLDGHGHQVLLNGGGLPGSAPGPYGAASFSGSIDYPRGFFQPPPVPLLGLHQPVAQRQSYRTQDDIDAWRLGGAGIRLPNGNGSTDGSGSFVPGSSFGPTAADGSATVPNDGTQPSLLYTPYQHQLPQPPQQHPTRSPPSSLLPSPAGGRPGSPSQLHPHQQQLQQALANHSALDGGGGFYPSLQQQQQLHQQQQHDMQQQQRWFQASGGPGLALTQQAPGSGQNSPGSYDHNQARF